MAPSEPSTGMSSSPVTVAIAEAIVPAVGNSALAVTRCAGATTRGSPADRPASHSRPIPIEISTAVPRSKPSRSAATMRAIADHERTAGDVGHDQDPGAVPPVQEHAGERTQQGVRQEQQRERGCDLAGGRLALRGEQDERAERRLQQAVGGLARQPRGQQPPRVGRGQHGPAHPGPPPAQVAVGAGGQAAAGPGWHRIRLLGTEAHAQQHARFGWSPSTGARPRGGPILRAWIRNGLTRSAQRCSAGTAAALARLFDVAVAAEGRPGITVVARRDLGLRRQRRDRLTADARTHGRTNLAPSRVEWSTAALGGAEPRARFGRTIVERRCRNDRNGREVERARRPADPSDRGTTETRARFAPGQQEGPRARTRGPSALPADRTQESISPAMNCSTLALQMSSAYCSGGDFMK